MSAAENSSRRRALTASPPEVACCLMLAAMCLAPQVLAQSEESPTVLSGTLSKVRDSGTITIAYRASSVPFSYVSALGEPIGYSIDLCKLVVEAIGDEVGRTIAIKWKEVTSETR